MIRDATAEDAAACAAIYAPYVTGTAITFETEVTTAAAFADRIAAAQRRHAWLVAERDGEVVGYAYGTALRPRPAYDAACETTVYLRRGVRRTGLGRALVTTLLPRLEDLGMRRALACIALPNDASVGLHRALGFREAGVWQRVGWKLDRWWDVAWFQKDL
jgi:L-amino acid N-acyltransferase YncA